MKPTSADILKKPILISLIFFVIASILGLGMRAAFTMDMPNWFNYRNMQHAHSHIALLGWLFAIFFIVIVHIFSLDWSKYSRLYWMLQGSVLGMLLTFPVIGYASLSIVFSSLHIVLAYLFIYKVWRDVNVADNGREPVLFLRTSLFFLALSTLGTWALVPIMVTGLKGSALYYASIQFYLHFQFNGWFIFGVIAIFFALLRSKNMTINSQYGRLFFWTLVIGTIMTYALAITWSTPQFGVFMINSIGVIVQLIALGFFFKIILNLKTSLKDLMTPYAYHMLRISFLALILKVIIQAMVVLPALAQVSYTVRNFVIGFIHLLMLGGLSLFAFSMISVIIDKPLGTKGSIVFIFGVVITELLLFLQGGMQWQSMGFLPNYYEMVVLGSFLIVAGLIMLLVNIMKIRKI